MTKAFALLALTAMMILASVGNYWFTFGIWPRSWVSMAGFGFLHVVLALVYSQIVKED